MKLFHFVASFRCVLSSSLAGRRLEVAGRQLFIWGAFGLLAGCGTSAPESSTASSPPPTSTPAANSGAPVAAESGAAPSATDSGVASPATPADSVASAPVASATEPSTPAAAAPAAPAEVRKVELVPPTAEQLASWTFAPYVPLQLLAAREPEQTRITAALGVTSDGKHFLTAGTRVEIWSIAKNEPEHTFLESDSGDPDHTCTTLAVSPDGKWFAVGDSKGMVRVWSLEDHKELAAKKVLSTGVVSLAISPDAQELATITYDKTVQIWNSLNLESVRKIDVDASGLKRIEYIGARQLAVAGEATVIWDTSTGKMVKELPSGRYAVALARSADGARFVFGGEDSLQLWNAGDLKSETTLTGPLSGSELVAFSPDGKLLATSQGSSVQIWNEAERRVVQIMDGHVMAVTGLQWLPQTGLLAVASELGCTRIWGTPEQGVAVELKPLHSPVEYPAEAGEAPANHSQLEQLIDLRIFPRFPGCEVQINELGDFMGLVPAPVATVQTFYGHLLGANGWTLVGTPAADPAALEFRRHGFALHVRGYEAGEGKTNVMVRLQGNWDLRRAPRFDGGPIETVFEAANAVMYTSKAPLLQIETNLLRKFRGAGWVGYVRLNSSQNEQPDARNLTFFRHASSLNVTIGKTPAAPDRYTVQYSLSSLNTSVPVPPDAGFVEFDGSTAPNLVATSKQTLDQLREYYDREMATQGWLVREPGRYVKPDKAWLSYFRGQDDRNVLLVKLPDGRTLVRVGEASHSLWELSQKKEEPADAGKPAGLEAADFPQLKSPHHAVVDRNDMSIEVTVEKSTVAAATEQFTTALAGLGWKAEEGGIRGEDYTLVTFNQGKAEITLRGRARDGNSVMNFQGDGLLWNKELPTDKQIVSFATWLRQNKLPAEFELIERYETESAKLTPGAAK